MFRNFAVFKKYVIPYWPLELVLVFFIMITNALSLSSPYILKLLIDNALPQKDFRYLFQLLYILLATYIVRCFVSYFSDLLYTRVSNMIMNRMRSDIFERVMNKKMSFFSEHQPAELVFYINGEIEKIEDTITYTLLRLANSIFSIIGLSIMLLLLNPGLFLASAVVFPFILFSTKYFTPRMKKLYGEEKKQESSLEAFFMERFTNIKLIKLLNAQSNQNQKLTERLAKMLSVKLNSTRLASLNRNITTFLVSLGPLIIFGVGGMNVLNNTMTLGALIAFIQYLLRLYSPSTDLVYLYNDILKTSASVDKIREYFDEKGDETVGGKHPPSFEQPVERIDFQNVSFGFEPENRILKSLSFSMEMGRNYAFVGRSGSGKSTIIHLLCAFYKSTSGSILINRKYNLDDLNKFSWRKKIMVISQGNNLINETIRENILLSNPGATDCEINQAVEYAHLDEFIGTMENGLDSYVGVNGSNLSGGQQQRVAIARIFLRDPEIIIIDEATSGIDTITEEQIFRKLKEIYRKSIIIVVSHRLSSIKDFATIFHLHEGIIEDYGDHNLLLSKKGTYWELFRNQL